LFREIRRVLERNGRFLLADVHTGSPVANFLDQFIGLHNSTGHQGEYVDESTLGQMQACGFAIERAERVSYRWWFAERGSMAKC